MTIAGIGGRARGVFGGAAPTSMGRVTTTAGCGAPGGAAAGYAPAGAAGEAAGCGAAGCFACAAAFCRGGGCCGRAPGWRP
jgi:hypothetical protein